MDKKFKIGDFLFRLVCPPEVLPPENFLKFAWEEAADQKETAPEYTSYIEVTDHLPQPEGKVLARRPDLLVFQGEAGESRLIGVKGTEGSGVSLSLFASGASGGGKSSHTGYSTSVERTAAAAPMNYGFGENALAGIMMFNTSKEVNTRTKHYLPVKTGISVTYGFTPRWYIGTGLTYSYLLSDSRTGSDAYYIDSRQAVHYLGIPLNIGYSIWKSSRVQIYASAGGMLEKCLGGTVRNSYVYSNDLRSGETEKLSITPLQWSVSAAAGLQLRLTEYVGIYVEPGVSYHFRTGSGIETSYSARPLDFSLSIGLRFSFERK